jgi:diguanylate cyclase (GGDEF)-like protein
MNLTLKQKIFLGYTAMIFFILIVGGYAIWSLQELNKITTSLIFNDLAAAEKLSKLNDIVLGQDLYEKRYLTLNRPDAVNMFWSRSREFKSLISEIGNSSDEVLNDIVERTHVHHADYENIFTKEASLIKDGKIDEAEKVSSEELKGFFNKVLLSLKDLDLRIKDQQNHHLNKSNTLGERALMITIILSIASLLCGILFASLITNHLNIAILKLKEATDSISSGNFDNLPEFQGADELADLAISFKEMGTRLKELETMNLDANPLTKLPGNLAIEKELLTRLNETQMFSFCLIDLDNFKAYSDRYGYAKGSDVLKWLGDLLLKIKSDYGAPDDFLGHIGGDDYVIICSPERVQKICRKVIEEFDKGIIDHYEPEDAQKGFIISVDRDNKPAIYGIMTVSLAVVNTDRTLIVEPKEVAQRVAELKQYAKTYKKSIYIMDRRRTK